MQIKLFSGRGLGVVKLHFAALLVLAGMAGLQARAQMGRVVVGSAAARPAGAVDAGAVADSAAVHGVTLLLRMSDAKSAELQGFLDAQMRAGSADYRNWISAAAYGARFGADDAAVAAARGWAEAQGLKFEGLSAGRTALVVGGDAAAVERAFGVRLMQVRVAGAMHFANDVAPTVPAELGGVVAGMVGLDDFVPSLTVRGVGPVTVSALVGTVDANAAGVMALTGGGCLADWSDAASAGVAVAMRQASAQGITVLAESACAGGAGFPGVLPEVTAIAGTSAGGAMAAVGRPWWQVANGLPDDAMRHEPDFSAGDIGAVAATVAELQAAVGGRLGNLNAALYELAPVAGLFTQTDGAAAGTYEAGSGLGKIDLGVLANVFPRGSTATSTSISASNFAPVHGSAMTLTATVTPNGGSGTPSGTVTFSSTQKGVLGSATLNGSSVGTFTTSTLTGGAYNFTATYSGDVNFAASTSGTAVVTVQGEPTMLSATVASGATLGGNVTVNVTAASASGVGTPTGTVTVTPQGTGSTTTYTGTLSSTAAAVATATVTFPAPQAGSFTLLVNCSGDANFTCFSPISVQANVGKGTSTTVVTIAPNPPTAGSPVTLTATVAGNASGTPPTGTVQFTDNGTVLGSAPVTSGSATFTATLAAGKTHSLIGIYSGDANYGTSTSSPVTAAGGQISTTTSLTSSSFAVSYGTAITLTSTVTPSSSAGVQPTGTVTFTASGQGVVGTGTVTGGQATLTLSNLAVGTYTLTASYGGDATYSSSVSTTSVIVTVSLVNATLAATISPLTNVPYGSTATVTATVSLPGGTGSPTGTVSAAIQGVTGAVYTATLSPNAGTGSATANIVISVPPPPGPYTVQVTCAGNTNFQCQTPVNLTINTVKGTSMTSLSVSPTAPQAGLPTTLTATLSSAGNGTAAYIFTGTVIFFDGATTIGTSPVASNQATAVVTLSGNKVHALTAVYSGDVNWTGSTSAAVTVTPTIVPSVITVSSNLNNALAGGNVTLRATVSSAATTLSAPTGSVVFFDNFNGSITTLGTSVLASTGLGTSVAVLSTTGLTAGTHNVFATYAGDGNYSASTSATASVTLSDFQLTLIPQTLTITRGQNGQVGIIASPVGGFSGTLNFGCTPPAGYEMGCSFSPASLVGSGTTTLTITTTAPKAVGGGAQAMLRMAGGGAALAGLLMLGVPGRRRRRAVLLAVLTAVMLLPVTGCVTALVRQPDGTGGGGTGTTDPGTPVGTTFLTITAAGTDGVSTVRHIYQYQVTIQ